MHKGFHFIIFLTLLVSICVSGSLSHAAPQEKPIVMEEVVVTATRDTEEVRKVPANVTVITAEQIEKSGATTMPEVLEKLESIQFRSYSGNSSQAAIDVRGFGGDNPFGKTLIMLDGRRLNRPDMSSINWLQVPLNNVERIEVVRGASSVLYGDAAIGGVINIITKKGEGPPKINASVMAGSYGLHDERVGVTGSTDKLTYALTGENNHNSGYRERSKFSSKGGGVNFGYEASKSISASFGVSFNKTDYQMPGALTKEEMEKNRRQYQPAGWFNAAPDDDGSDKYTNVNLGVTSHFGSWGQMDVNFSYGRKDLQMNMASWYSYNYANTNIDTYGVTPKYILSREVFGFQNKLILGLDYYHESYKKDFFSARERTTKISWADLTKNSLSFYIRDDFSVLKTLILSIGFRSERATIEGSNTDVLTPANNFADQEKTYRAEAYEAGLTWLVGKKSKIFTKVATVYRIPFIDEVAYIQGGAGGFGFLRNLEKEKGVSMEAGAEWYPLDNLKIGLTAFRIKMEDEIRYTGMFPNGHMENLDKTRHDGIETSLSYLWEKRVKVYGNFTYHKATFENGPNDGKEMPLVPKLMANGGIEIYLPYNLTLRPEVRYVGQSYLATDDDNNTEKMESYTLYNLYLLYKPTFGKLTITAFFGVENLTDEKFSSYGLDYAQYGMPNFYYPMPGIVWKGGLSFEF